MDDARIDFMRPLPRRRWPGRLIALVAVGALLWTLVTARDLARTRDELVLRVAERPAPAARPAGRLAPAEDKSLLEENERARRVLQRLGIPWHELFRALESAVVPGVSLAAVQPNVASRQVRISGEAASLGAAVRFVDRLAAGKRFANVHLVQHERRAANSAVGFVAVAEWGALR